MGEVFAGRYELVDVIADGGMGTVWRVWDPREHTYRAAKMLKQSDSASLLRFVRETSTRVEHDHVVAPTGWSAEDDRVLFAMPLVDGGSVATLVGDFGSLPDNWVRELTLQLLSALEAVHAVGVVHRDVKPANLLLRATGTGRPHLLLSDFGIAVVRGEPRLTRTTDLVHTPGYTAPEASRGADPDPRQDLYAVGVVMQEMLTGRRPEPGALPEPPAGAFAEVRSRLVATDPARRFPTAGEALAALETLAPEPEPDAEGAIEVFDHLARLPDGWGSAGPVLSSSVDKRGRWTVPDPHVRLRLLAAVLAAAGLVLVVAALLTL